MDRRRFLREGAQAFGAFALAPALLRQDSARPLIVSGVATGDVTSRRAIVWSCTDRPARMLIDWDTTESFQNPGQIVGPLATPETGFTARLELLDLPPDQRIFYRLTFEDLSDAHNVSVPVMGSFLSAPDKPKDISFAWSAD